MEYLDLINEEDVVTGKAPRTEVHAQGYLHREIHVWMFDENKNIIFQRRGIQKSSGGLLDATAGGHVDAGETYETTAIREAKEETGVSVETADLVLLEKFRQTFTDEVKHSINNFLRNVYIYKKPVSFGSLVREPGNVGMDFVLFSPEQLASLGPEKAGQFDTFILTDEVPMVLEFLKTIQP